MIKCSKGFSICFLRVCLSRMDPSYGTFGRGVSFAIVNKYAKAVIYARFEESYQRYLLAKEFGREK